VPIIVHTFHCFSWQVARTEQKRPWHILSSAAKKWFYVLIERFAASVSDALIMVCELNKKEAIDLNLAPCQKFTTIYSSVDLSRFKTCQDPLRIRLDLGISPNQPVIGMIGRLSIQKAPLDFVAAAKKVLQQKPNVQFIVVPAFGAERMVEQIENLYDRLLVKKGYYESHKGEKTYFLQNCPPTLTQ